MGNMASKHRKEKDSKTGTASLSNREENYICKSQSSPKIPQKSHVMKQSRKAKSLITTLKSTTSSENELLSSLHDLSIDDKPNEILLEDLPKVPKAVLYYGWFFSHEVSLLIKEISNSYMNECLKNVEQFRRFMISACEASGIRDPESLYKKPGAANISKELTYHLTAKFLGRELNIEYATMVQRFIGKPFRIHLVGLYFTKKTFGIRVQLTDAQKAMFDEREGRPNRGIPIKIGGDTDTIEDVVSQLENELSSYESLYKTNNKTITQKCKSTIHSNFFDKINGISLLPRNPDDYQPTKSRAHITVGCAPNVKAVQTGIDLLDIIDLEKRENAVFHQDFKIDGGTLRQFGRFADAFVIYPCHELVAEATFNYFL